MGLGRTIKEAIKAIKEGEVLVCPSDTVYGLIGDAKNKETVKQIFKIKKRLKKQPIGIFVKNIKQARQFAYINKTQETLLKKFWPGKLTVILKAKKKIPGITSKSTVGIRVVDCKLINGLLKKLNSPLAQTSANISGKPASTEIKEVLGQFKNKKLQPDLVLEVGNLPVSLSSTVIDLTSNKIKILRQGAVKI